MAAATGVEPIAQPGSRRRTSLRDLLYTNGTWMSVVAIAVGGIITWELLVEIMHVPPYLLPAPSDVVAALVGGFGSGLFVVHSLVTLQEILSGFVLAVVFAFTIAIVVTRWQYLERIIMPFVVMLQTVPKVAIAPLILVWFGFGIESKIVTTALLAFFPLLVNVIVGLGSVDRDRLDMFRAWNASEWQIFRMLRFPHALPYIFAGLSSAMVFSIVGAIVAEFVGAQKGLGYLIQTSTTNLNVSTTFAVLVILSTFGLLMEGINSFASRRIVFWQGKGLQAISGA